MVEFPINCFKPPFNTNLGGTPIGKETGGPGVYPQGPGDQDLMVQ